MRVRVEDKRKSRLLKFPDVVSVRLLWSPGNKSGGARDHVVGEGRPGWT